MEPDTSPDVRPDVIAVAVAALAPRAMNIAGAGAPGIKARAAMTDAPMT